MHEAVIYVCLLAPKMRPAPPPLGRRHTQRRAIRRQIRLIIIKLRGAAELMMNATMEMTLYACVREDMLDYIVRDRLDNTLLAQ